ncbi:MAG: ribonuclease P protein component [Planctomycetota bacterium]
MKQFGLSRKERITSARDFDHIYRKGAVRKSGCLAVRSLPNNLRFSRLGIAVSKKSFPKSVTRNRIKRLVREAFRLNKHHLPKGLDLVVGVRPKGMDEFTLAEIQSGLLKAFPSQI